MQKRVVLVVGILLVMLIALASAQVDNSVQINQSSNFSSFQNNSAIVNYFYSFGDSVKLSPENISGIESVKILYLNQTFLFSDLRNGIEFLPLSAGNYSLVTYRNNSILQTFTFIVNQNPDALFTGKPTYALGESAEIYIGDVSANKTLSVRSDSGVFRLEYMLASPLTFTPSNVGEYEISLFDALQNRTLKHNFSVTYQNDSRGEVSLKTDKKEYLEGEFVRIKINYGKNENYLLTIASPDSLYSFFGEIPEEMSFKPSSVGAHVIRIESGGKNLASYGFDVIPAKERDTAELLSLEKTAFFIGEQVRIAPSRSLDFVKIFFQNSTFEYEGVGQNITFTPTGIGTYSITAIAGNLTSNSSFYVLEKKEQESPDVKYSFDIASDAVIDIDVSELAGKKRTILNILFGTSPIDELSFYVKGHNQDPKFLLSAEQLEKYFFRIRIKSSTEILPETYSLVADAKINDEVFLKEILFEWVKKTENPGGSQDVPNESLQPNPELEKIRKYTPFVFTKNEDAVIEADFTNSIGAKRDILEIALKQTKLEQITAYLKGHEFDNKFNLSIEHLELDKFKIHIMKNEEFVPDAYTLVAVGRFEGKNHVSETVFSWGITNSSYFAKRLEMLNNPDITTRETNETPVEAINQTPVKEINKTFSNQTSINETPVNPTAKDENIAKNNAIVYTDRQKYYLGELVTIHSDKNISRLQIAHNGSIFYVLEFNSNVSFLPPSQGIYEIESIVLGLEKPFTLTFNVTNTGLAQNISPEFTKIEKTSLEIKDSKNKKLEYDIKFYKKDKLVEEVSERNLALLPSEEIPKGVYDADIIILDSPIKKLSIKNVDIRSGIELGIDDVPENIESLDRKKVLETYSIDPSGLNFSNGTLTAVAKGTELYKCIDWNFTLQACEGQWEKIMDIIPGQEYNVEISPFDPGFAETGLASINTNKSIYHPNEDVEMLVVVLDTGGHLVSDASVTLNVTKPDGASQLFSTADSSITLKEKGIYKSTFANADLEGNYSLYAKASGASVDSAMSSFFTVKQFYEFDILRNSPVVTDPWKGPFDSSIRITSLANISIFDFSEVLPIEFEVIDSGGAVESVLSNKKILTWNNLNSGSLVSYSAKPPLITPELWELGPSFVNYSGIRFSETRPWFLAVDPARVVNVTQPDAGAPGMNIVVQFIGNNFNYSDNVTVNTTDIKVGPIRITNDSGQAAPVGRVLSTVFFISSDAIAKEVQVNISGVPIPNPFKITIPKNNSGNFSGVSGARFIGDGKNGTRTFGGTIVLDSLIIPSGLTVSVNSSDPDNDITNGHQGYMPAIIIVKGQVNISGILNVSGSGGLSSPNSAGGHGGPGGGGGGGAGMTTTTAAGAPGGNGYSGGAGGGVAGGTGGDGGNSTKEQGTQNSGANGGAGGNILSGNLTTGGRGGLDAGAGGNAGGGGSGFPFGTGGKSGSVLQNTSFGGGGGGGSSSESDGGGGGGFGTNGTDAVLPGTGAERGIGGASNGNAQLIPLQGGSGGGGGSADEGAVDREGGGGGGGGGSILIFSNSTISITGTILAEGGDGGNGEGVGGTGGSGGGGGSGGAIIIQSLKSSATITGTLSALNGTGGLSSTSGTEGGDGGHGRIRVDGLSSGTSITGLPSNYFGSAFMGPSITTINNTHITGRANQTSTIEIFIQSSTSTRMFNATADSNGNFSVNVSFFTGKNFITAIQNMSNGRVSVMSSASVSTYNYTDTGNPLIDIAIDDSTPNPNQRVNITATVSDGFGLSYCQFIDNQTLPNGAKNYYNKSVSGLSGECSQNYTIRLGAGNTINFTVIVNDTSNNVNQSTIIIDVTSSPPNISQVSCSPNNGAFGSCGSLAFGDSVGTVRVGCNSTSGGTVHNVTFVLKNLDDDKIYFNVTTNISANGNWEYNASNFTIVDSGDFSMHIACMENPTTENYTNWSIAYGRLSSSLISPSSNVNVSKNRFFNFSSSLRCIGGECGNVNATLDPSSTDLVYSVENFTITLASGVANASAIVTKGQNLSNSVPFASRMSNDPTGTTDNWASMNANVSFLGNNSVIVHRGETTSTVTVNIYVVEFNPIQVRVQRGSFAMAAASASATSSVTAVNRNKTAMVFYYGGLGTNPEHGANAVRGNFTANSTLIFSRGGTTGAIAGSYYLFEDLGNNFNVQPVDFSLAAAQVNSTRAVNELNLNRTFMIGSYEAEDTGDLDGTGQKTIRLDFPNNRTVQAIRNQSTGVINISAYAITFNTGLRVQRGYFFFPAGDALESSSISAIDLNNSVPWLPVRQPGAHSSGDLASSDNPGATMMVRFDGNSTINGVRATTDIDPFGFSYWEVLQWDAPTSASSSSSKGMISMTPGATPFYTTSQNSMTPLSLACLGNLTNLSSGGYCNTTWRVNATGTVDTTWEFYVDYSPINKSAKLLSALNGNLTGIYTDFGGNYSNLTNNDTSYWYVGNENTDILPYEVISAQEFSYTLNNIDRGTVSNLTLNLVYCHSGNGASSVGCTGTAPTGTVEVDQNVSIFNYNLNQWLSLGSLDINTAGNEKESIFYPNGTLSGYINISDNTIKFRVRAHFTNTILGSSTFLVMDMANLTVSYRGYTNNLTSNQTQRINITIVANSAPSVSSISISPSTPSGNSDINCTFYINDNALDELTANVSWYNGTALGYSEIISVQKNLQYVRTLAAGNTTPDEQWKCGVTPFDGELFGSQLNSSTVTIGASQPPAINSIECQEDGITWEGCPNILFYNNLTAVRANCTDSDGTVANVTFNLTNLNDPIYYFSSNATYNSLGFFVYNNSDINISDSGSFNLSVQCQDDSGVINYNNSVWTIPFGTLTAQLISPVSDSNATQNRFFNFTSRVTCSGGECGYLNATLDPFGTWALSNWSQRRQINISNIGVSSLTNFPAYLNITYDSDMQADFDDLRFTNGSCGSDGTLLDYEVENITSVNAEIWIKIPTLYSGINSICMYYGNPLVLQGNNSASVWDQNYTFVQHLHETPSDASTGSVHDSTSYGRDGTPNNFQDGGGGTTNTPGKIDGADDFGGDDDDIDFGTGCLSSNGSFTVETWFNAQNGANFDRLFVQGTTACAAREIMLFWNTNQINGRLGGGTGAAQVATAAFSANAWHHLVWTFDGTTHIMYLDGSVSSGTPSASNVGVGGNIYLGRRDSGNFWDGLVDEVRMSTSVRGGIWANESYQLAVNQSVLVKNGTEENRTKGMISTNIGASPFYTIDSNPMTYINDSCLGNMKPGDSCDTAWRVNATGFSNTIWEFFVNYSLVNYSSSINSSLTAIINITILQNTAPNTTSVSLLPSPAATNQDLNCSYKIDDYGTFDSLSANISFYKNNVYNYSSIVGVTNHATEYFIFGNGNTTPGDSWICGVTPSDELTIGAQKNSTSVTILSSLPPVVISLDCQENGSIWEGCQNLRFTDILTAVRINCTSTIGLKNATFNFTNLPDQRTYFFNTTNRTDSGGLYVFNNTDIAINDSGEFSLNASCADIANVSSVTYTNWTLPWGTLSVSLVDPASATNVERNAFFTFTAQVVCSVGECGDVNATLDPLSTSLVYSVENFTITLGAGVANASAILTKVQNSSNAVPFATRMSTDPTSTGDDWTSMNVNVSISGNTTTIRRGGTSSVVTVNVYVVEFNPRQVRVQGGSFLIPAGSLSATSSVTAVNTNKTALVFYSGSVGTNPEFGSNAVRGNFTANTTLRFSRGEGSGAVSGSYYIFEDIGTNFDVKPVDFSIGTAATNNSVGVSQFNLNRTFIIGSYEAEDTGDVDAPSQKAIRLDLQDNQTVRAIRNQSTGVINISAYVITFVRGINVQRGYFNFPAGDRIESSSISAVDLNWSVPWIPVRQPGAHSSTALAASDNSGATMMVRLPNNSTIDGLRNTTDVDPFGFSYWEVLSWDALTPGKGMISMTAGTIPFYTTSQNPMNGSNNSCLSGMVAGSTCQVAWQVNATGQNNLTSEFFVDFNLTTNRAYVSDGQTPHVNITITDATVVPPVVTLVSPANATITRNTTILFNCSATDNSQLKNITFYSNFNGVFGVNGSNLIGGKSNQTNFTRTLTDGVYQWNCIAYDTDGNSDQGNSNRIITIDTTAPVINLSRPLNNSALTGATLDFNFTVTDNIDTSLFCNLTIDSVIVDTNFAALNGSNTSRSITDLTQGNHKWNVTCVDDAQNSGTSFTFNFSIIDIGPTVNLTAPPNGSLNPFRNINLSYNASDNNGIENASLILDGIVNQTDSSVPNGIIDFFTAYNLSEGYHNWTVNVTDISGLSDIKPVRYFLVDYSPPLINLTGPPYNFTSNVSSVEFNFTAIDNFDTVVVCNLTINGSVADSNFNANNGTVISRTVSGLTDGHKLWNVTCKDDGNVTNTSQSWIVNISVSPTVSLNSPASGFMQNSPNITLYYTPNDNTNITSCTLLLDGFSNLSNSTISLNAQNNFTLANLQSKVYNWTVNCTDPIGLNAIASPVRNFTIDFGKPNITLFYPLQNQSIFNSQIDFNFSVTDDIDSLISCNLTLDGIVNISGIQSPNGTVVNSTITVSTGGNHFWNVTCIDDAGNFNISETRNFTVFIPTTVSLISPADNEVINHTLNVTFEYTVDDSVAVPNASLIINGLVNQTVQNPVLGETSNFFYVNFSIEGFYTWTVNATNINGQIGTAATRNFTIDQTPPIITYNHPFNGENLSYNNVTFNFTVTDNLDILLDCNVTIDGIVQFRNLSIPNGTTQIIYNISFDGLHNWSVDCTDHARLINSISTVNFTVEAPPNITLNFPILGYRTNQQIIIFNYTPIDAIGFQNCTFFIDGAENDSSTEIQANVPNFFAPSAVFTGAHNWTVKCFDSAPDLNNYTAPNQTFIIDLLGPGITLNHPSNGEVFNTDDIYFNLTATDFLGALNLTCNITLDTGVNVSNIFVASGISNATLIENLSQGTHSWNATCWDDFNNTNSSATNTFTVNSPDLKINASGITFNNTNPDENNSIGVNATIFNIGGIPANNFSVLFYDGALLFGNVTVETLDSGRNTTVNSTFNATRGLHQIFVNIFFSGIELNSSNNNATNNLSLLLPVINSPPNNTLTTNSTNLVNFTLFDFAQSSLNYTLYLDGVFNRTSASSDNSSVIAEFNLSEGIHRIIVEAFGPRIDFPAKELGNTRKKNSTQLYITVDQTAPISQFETLNRTWFSDNTPEIRFNITDNLDSVLNYTLFINGISNQTNYTSNGTSAGLNLLTLSDGNYSLIIESFDDAGNRRNSTFIIINIDTIAPVPRIITLNNSNFTDSTPEINFNITDNLAPVINYTFYADNVTNRVRYVQNGANSTDNLTSLIDGYHIIILEATDLAGNKANSSFINITIDSTAPTVTIESPTEGQALGYLINLLTTVSDNFVGLSSVTYSLSNDSLYYFKNGTLNASTNFDDIWDSTLDISESVDFMYINFTVTANDTFGNTQTAVRRFIVDNRRPSITFVIPLGHYFNSNFSLDIRVQNRNLTISTYNITNSTNSLVLNNSNASIYSSAFNWTNVIGASNQTLFPEGLYNITVFASDESGNNRTSGSFFYIDRTPPSVTLFGPLNNSNISFQNISFSFNATDNFAARMVCNLTINGIVNLSGILALNSSNTSVNVSGFNTGAYNWSVICTDNATNVGISNTFYFNVTPPDLEVSASDIRFNTTLFEENINFTVFANITNIGRGPANDVLVQFFKGHPDNGGIQIGSDFILNLEISQNRTINVSTFFGIGSYDIFVAIDRDSEIAELDETNNIANASVNISSYMIINGNITGNLVLQSVGNGTAYSWSSSNDTAGNIFVVDSDSVISWTNLTAIGVNITLENVSNDFEDIDRALNTTQLFDSVNRTFTQNGIPKSTFQFLVFSQSINSTPIINSTNTSSFITGILWDSSDINLGQYNGSQDLVFITRINKSQQGYYGTYDFEIKVPSKLREYKKPDFDTSVTFYVELR